MPGLKSKEKRTIFKIRDNVTVSLTFGKNYIIRSWLI